MEIKINKKGNKMLLKADDGEELIIAPRHLPSIRRTPYEIACDEFELTIETNKANKKPQSNKWALCLMKKKKKNSK